jgi:hypothetical protein
MAILKFKGRTEKSGANVSYITRESACESISFHNLDQLDTGDRYDNKVNALTYAHNREDEETKGRNHYRVVLDLDVKEDTDRAKQMAHEFLQKEFPNARAIVAIHQDTDHTHAHVWIDAREMNDRKIHSPKNHINQLCKTWQQQCDREYGTERTREFADKREETRQTKEAKYKGLDVKEPERAPKMTAQDYREKELRDAGVRENGIDKEPTGRNQRPFESRDSPAKEANRALAGSEQSVEESKRSFNQSVGQSDRTEQAVRGLQQEVDRVAELEKQRELENEREQNRGYER